MTLFEPDVIKTAARLGLMIMAVGLAPAVYRIVRGPQSADRIIALELLSILVVALVVLLAVFSGEKAFLDVAVAYALVAFLGTVAFARYLERSATRKKPKPTGDRHE